ncbi:MAG: presenilin family intramembrane aspartyl protease [Euryarchaeota archaeon]|nr:presenilin family intramembrane aspartyl protease [Euryarchaeota archaeon]
MKDKAFIVFNFLIVQFLGLFVTEKFFKNSIVIIEGGSNLSISFYLFFVILFVSGVVLALIKLNLSKFLYYFVDYVGLFVMAYYVFTFFVGTYVSLTISSALLLVRYRFRQWYVLNLCTIILSVGVVSFLGTSLAPMVIAILMILLSVYDIISVYKTKHMITLAEDVMKREGSQVFKGKIGDETIAIGAADIIFPNLLIISVYYNYNFVSYLLTAGLSLVGLLLVTQFYTEEGIPAMPFVSLGVIGFTIALFL